MKLWLNWLERPTTNAAFFSPGLLNGVGQAFAESPSEETNRRLRALELLRISSDARLAFMSGIAESLETSAIGETVSTTHEKLRELIRHQEWNTDLVPFLFRRSGARGARACALLPWLANLQEPVIAFALRAVRPGSRVLLRYRIRSGRRCGLSLPEGREPMASPTHSDWRATSLPLRSLASRAVSR